jgi:hypothetical protein
MFQHNFHENYVPAEILSMEFSLTNFINESYGGDSMCKYPDHAVLSYSISITIYSDISYNL